MGSCGKGTTSREEDTHTSIWQTLDLVPPADDVHERHARNFPDSPAQVSIAGCDNVTL